MRVAVLMPSFDEAARIGRVLAELSALPAECTVFVVDDGSRVPLDASELEAFAPNVGLVLARHVVNLGQGAALETARRLALGYAPFDVYVTMDADGQHTAADVMSLARAVADGADVALGTRRGSDSNVPFARRALLTGALLLERFTSGLPLTDAHNGLRAFRREVLADLRLRQNRMAHASEITRQLGRAVRTKALRWVEVPVAIRYTRDSLAKGQKASGAIAILVDLFRGYLFERGP